MSYSTSIVSNVASQTYGLSLGARPPAKLAAAGATAPPASLGKAQELKDAFSTFVGETFYGQMMKSMRKTVGKPAYFHGGQAEEVFRSQLDQQLAQDWAAQSGDRFAEAMFEQQFPVQARLLEEADRPATRGLESLGGLRRW